ncbi:hypothetical protein Cgig2_006899 [Carnegiea gigantea]|uniref:PGG domain-containing protein n=1 Tax=Carnegiea gigantea TaxID=171969 RepID=A0A9Q1QBP2_9CARY|nr:hypothetical protein Cgig2_006899 [Carnegiea gigantea]
MLDDDGVFVKEKMINHVLMVTYAHQKVKAASRWYWKRWHEVSEKLFERLGELITATDTNGLTILHKWVEPYSQSARMTKNRIARMFADFFQNFKGDAAELMLATDHKDRNNVLHHMATSASIDMVAERLIELYKTWTSKPSNSLQNHDGPWSMENRDGDTPLALAIRNKRDKLAVHFLSADPVRSLRLSDRQNPFIFAVCNQCDELAKEILAKVAEHDDLMSLLPFDDKPGPDILRFALRFPETFIKEVKEKLPSSPKHDIKLGSCAEYRVFNRASWKPMDAELKKAAWSGDVDFLRRDKIASEPWTYWLSRYISTEDGVQYAGNILHLAIGQDKMEFVKQAMKQLPHEVVNLLLCQQETAGKHVNSNPLHLAVLMKRHPIVKAIADRDDHLRMSLPEVKNKYTAQDSKGRTPALLAIQEGDSCCADILTSKRRAELIQDIVDNEDNSPLFLAVQNGLPNVVSNLLDCDGLCSSGPDGSTAVHVAPGLLDSSTNVDDIYQKLLRLPNLITKRDNKGFTVLHNWAEMGCKPADGHVTDKCNLESLLNYFFKNHGADATELMFATDSRFGNNPLHVLAATSTSTSTFSEHMAVKIAIQLVDLFEKWMAPNSSQNHDLPWLKQNNNRDTPLLLAIHCKLEDLALCFLQKDPKNSLIASDKKENPLKLAVSNGCQRVVVEIISIIAAHNDLHKLLAFSDGSTILDAASAPNFPEADAETIIRALKEKFPSYLTQDDGKGETPLEKASKAGKLQLVELMVKHCPSLKDTCLERRDTPLHHIRGGTYAQYKRLLRLKVIEEMKNTQDLNYETPLHKSVRSKDLPLTNALLTTNGIDLDLENNDGKTAMDLLAEEAKHDYDWFELCKLARIDPILKLTYAQRAEYFLKLRQVLLVVATLLATITFQAGFTLPGGLNSGSGEAILAKKPAFLVFLLADAYALCCSMLVLFCLVRSMSCGRDKSIILIRHSVSILFQSLYGSLATFVSGVFIVISRTSLWPTIIIIVMSSLIGLVAMEGGILCWVLNKFNSAITGVHDKLRDVLLITLFDKYVVVYADM